MDDYHSRSSSASLSTLSSHPVIDATKSGSQESSILDLMDEFLSRADSSLPPMPIEDPTRKLLLSSPVLQVVNSNAVKDQFLFLFNDILVIAKPILHDRDSLMDPSALTVLDRRFIIKNVQLRNLHVKADRDDNRTQAHMSGSLKHSITRTFVHNFTKDPDHAIATLFEKARSRGDLVGLGQLIFRTLDLDRAKLSNYLSRRTSKLVLKAYIDGFGFSGLRIDHALRVFLQSISVPSKPSLTHNPMESILDAFGSRWYEAANPGAVTYDKDLAVKLTKAIVQLNEVLHGGVGQEPGPTGHPLRNFIARDFVGAFRRYDPRGQVSDELLEEIYTSIRNGHLTQACAAVHDETDIIVVVKRALPTRLTYRIQSEPIILRIPQPDPDLSI